MSLFSNPRKAIAIIAALGFLTLIAADDSWARAGGSRSSGSAGSRTSSSLGGSSTTTQPSTGSTTSQTTQSGQNLRQTTPQQPASGGFMRGLAGGLLGGFVGSMLFGGLGHAGGGSFGGGGIGLFDIILIGGGLYLLWRYMKKRKTQEQSQAGYQAASYQQDQTGYSYQGDAGQPSYAPPPPPPPPPPGHDVDQGITHIRSMDPAFDPRTFTETVSDIFFQVQAAWGKRALEPIRGLLTEEMYGIFSAQVQEMIDQGRANKLENVSVRSVDIVEAWQEQGNDYVTARFFANLLDYTIDVQTNQVVSGSDSIPVKFEEFWTFARPVGPNPWRLTAVTQVN